MWARGATLLLVLPAAAFDSRTTHATLLEADVVALERALEPVLEREEAGKAAIEAARENRRWGNWWVDPRAAATAAGKLETEGGDDGSGAEPTRPADSVRGKSSKRAGNRGLDAVDKAMRAKALA